MYNILKGETQGFPVFVVFSDREVLGVFVDRSLAEECRIKNLDFTRPVTIQQTYIEGIKTITYELEKSVKISKPESPEIVAFNSMTIKGVCRSENKLKIMEHNIFDAYVLSKQGKTMLYIYRGNGEWYTFKYENNFGKDYAEYNGIINLK